MDGFDLRQGPPVMSEWQRSIVRVLLNALALGLTAALFDSIRLGGFFSAVLAVLILAFSNAFIRPIFLLLTLPLTVMTLGLFTLVINAGLFKLTSVLVPGFHVGGFWSALGGAFVYSLLTLSITSFLLPPPGGPRITFHYRRF
ncbi:MAG: phage holin family protein [Syntrophobacteria bacterium]